MKQILHGPFAAGYVLIFLCNVLSVAHAFAQQLKPPVIPVGLDAYRHWERWPMQRIGDRAYMRSTYDRRGGNEGADASHFLYMKGEKENVTLDVEGKGILYFVRTNHWHGSPWLFSIDHHDFTVRETATADPVNAIKKFNNTAFLPAGAFPPPLAYTWSQTKGADLSWVPMGFSKSLQIAYGRTHYGTGYYIYHLYATENLSHPIRNWRPADAPDPAVLALLNRAGTDIAPRNIARDSGTLILDRKTKTLAVLRTGPSVIRAFKITVPMRKAMALERMRLQMTWDGRSAPSVDAPLCLFFGAGTLYNRDRRDFLVKAFPVNIRFDYPDQKVTLSCYFPMPFFRSARISLSDLPEDGTEIGYEIRYEPFEGQPSQSSYFHVTYHDHPQPEPGKDLTLLDTEGIENARQWSGSFVGTSFIFSHRAVLNTLEGDPRFFFDNSQTPQAYGTGTEEWGGGGDYWGGENMTLPFAGHPCGARSMKLARNPRDQIESAYRFLLTDLMPFGNRALIRMEHGGENLSSEHYETLAYWYGLPAPALVETDYLDVGDSASEAAHTYASPGASAIQTLQSRYEWGIDTLPARPWGLDPRKTPGLLPGKEVYPTQQENGRFTRGSSEFTITVDPHNEGVLLRRTLDYQFPNQKALVYVRSGKHRSGRWKPAGAWYLAGSNTCVYSNPKGETDERQYTVETSNRRLRDDEFMLPARLTRHQAQLQIKLVYVPVDTELYPGHPYPVRSAWSELGYHVYSYIMPHFSAP